MFHLKSVFILALVAFSSMTIAQEKGNYDYRANSRQLSMQVVTRDHIVAPEKMPQLGDLTFSIKGLFNVRADSYLAIFTSTQVGETEKEANYLLKSKLDSIRKGVEKQSTQIELFVDMISFIPLYETQVEKKIFSKKTYNEIPMGFELKKNLHFKYSDPKILEYLVTICAEYEIYDLVRVDHFIEDIDKKKNQMILKAEGMLKQKIFRYGQLTNEDYKDKNRIMTEAFKVHLPHEQYQKYTAFASNAMYVKQAGLVTSAPKTTSEFYMPLFNKNFDFVINAGMLEPVVQIEYEVVIRLVQKPEEPKVEIKPTEIIKEKIVKQLYWVTPNGDIKQVNF